jgi:AcrR family transcriptional regulator
MTGMSDGAPADRPVGLRERKKARTRAAIREHAIRLFRQQGYSATTVEQIAAAADISPATFFRYFPTKEDVVLQDDMDVLTLEALAAQPLELSPLAAIRAAAAQTVAALTPEEIDRLEETTRLTMIIPEVRAAAVDELTASLDQFSDMIAQRVGRSPDDLAVRATAGAVIGVIMAVTLPPVGTVPEDIDMSHMFQRIDAALAQLEAGLPL